jgi:hypothetical protein
VSGSPPPTRTQCIASERRRRERELSSSSGVIRVSLVARPRSTLLYTGLMHHSTAPHHPKAAKPTNISRHHHHAASLFSHLVFFLLIIHYTTHLHLTRAANTAHTLPHPHALYPSVPACPCPTHRPVTRPPPDSPRPRYPYNPSRASAPSVDHLPSLPVAQHHCAFIHHRPTLLINHPIYRTIHRTFQGPLQLPTSHHETRLSYRNR